jgi:hypothetical protein
MRSKVAAFVVLFFTGSCKETPPEPPPPPPPPPQYVRTIDLTVVDTGLTDAYLRVKFLDTVQTRAFRLHRDGMPVLTVPVAPLDTVLLQDSLALHTTYTYRAYRMRDTVVIDSSLSLTLTTLDTTSHDFTFQTWQFGQHSSSVFNDVAIIDENNIWAVGEVYPQGAELPFNLARWDGVNWTLSRILFPDCDSSGHEVGTGPHPAQCIFALSSNDIWIASSVSLVHWNGQVFQRMCLPFGYGEWGFTKMFGWENKLYLVGYGGWIAYYNGATWQRVASETMTAIYDVWGGKNSSAQTVVLCAVSDQFEPGDRRILRINPGGMVDSLQWRTDRRVASVWFSHESRLFACGGGVFTRRGGEAWVEQTSIPLYYTYRVRGVANNDVFVAGAFGLVAHFSGLSWRVWENLGALIWYSAAYSSTGSFVVVGQTSSRAIILRMQR